MTKIRLLLTAVLLCCLSACASWPKMLPIVTDILAVVVEANQTMQQIQAAAAPLVKMLPAEQQTQIAKAEVKANAALRVLTAMAHGGKELQQAEVDKAFADFATAYRELVSLLESSSVLVAAPGGDVKAHAFAGPGGVVVVDPMAVTSTSPVDVER